jgi:hypothetical protein
MFSGRYIIRSVSIKNLIFRSYIMKESFFKSGRDIYEYFPWLGLTGFFVTLGESAVFGEFSTIAKIIPNFQQETIFLIIGFIITLSLFTFFTPFFIKRSTASMFSVSLVSQVFWSYLVEILMTSKSPKGYEYYIGFVLLIVGISIFIKFPMVRNRKKTEESTLLHRPSSAKDLNEKDNNIINERSGSQIFLKKDSQNRIFNDNVSETSSCTPFSSNERKITYYKNASLHLNANKYMNNN